MARAQGYEPTYRTINRFRIQPEVKELIRQCFVQFRCQLVQEELIERWGLDYRPRCRRKTPCCNQYYAMWADPQHYTEESEINDSLHLQLRHFITAHKQATKAFKRWQMTTNCIGG
ncbi:hypothetical protein ACVWXS_004520 [Lysinibacillus sp. TE18511]